jgi:diguanylate cyclase (GGDEF)-like protein
MLNLFYAWRFYTYGREQYSECMNKLFSNNLINLCRTSKIVAILAVGFSIFPIVSEQDFLKAGVYMLAALIALGISLFSNYQMQQINVKNNVIHFLLILFFVTTIALSIFLDLSNAVASIFPCFLICALLIFVNSPRVNFLLTLAAVIGYITSVIIVLNIPSNLFLYIQNSIIAGFLSLYFNWHITKLRFGLEMSTSMLEDEKNKYLDQSTVDELTQLKNRRDFMNTFQRYLSNYRSSDDLLCIALADIDFFKFYNDHYGHPQGDECLRSIGVVLNQLKEDVGVYSARVGGEEFALLWFEKDISNVDKVISHWTKKTKDLKIIHEKSKVSDFVTMSIGVYVTRCGSPYDVQALYDLADKALYAAKGSGRNCAIVNGDEIKQYKITSA